MVLSLAQASSSGYVDLPLKATQNIITSSSKNLRADLLALRTNPNHLSLQMKTLTPKGVSDFIYNDRLFRFVLISKRPTPKFFRRVCDNVISWF